VVLLYLISWIMFLFELFRAKWWINFNNFVLIIKWNFISTPINLSFFYISEWKRLQIIKMLNHILRHFVNLIRVPWNFFVKNTWPYQSVKLIVWIINTLSIYKKMEVKVSSYLVHIVVYIFNLFCFPQDINIVHFAICHFIESFN